MKLKIEIYEFTFSAKAEIRRSLNALTNNRASITDSANWVDNVLACSFSDEEIALINRNEGPYPFINKDCCVVN